MIGRANNEGSKSDVLCTLGRNKPVILVLTLLIYLASNSEWPKGSISRAFAVRIRIENWDEAGFCFFCFFALGELSILPQPAFGYLKRGAPRNRCDRSPDEIRHPTPADLIGL